MSEPRRILLAVSTSRYSEHLVEHGVGRTDKSPEFHVANWRDARANIDGAPLRHWNNRDDVLRR